MEPLLLGRLFCGIHPGWVGLNPPTHRGIYTHLGPYIRGIDSPHYTMETAEKNPQHMNRTEYVIANITGVKTPLELKTAEKLASRRLGELEAIIKGISTKWFKGKLDEQMLAQTRAEMDKITQALSERRQKFGAV